MYGIIFAISILVIAVGIFLWLKGNHLSKKGKVTKAIIIANQYKPGTDIGNGAYYPVVRFKTETQEWITQELSIGYSPAKAVGTEVEIIYDPKNPGTVGLNSKFLLETLPRILVAMGACGVVFVILGYLV